MESLNISKLNLSSVRSHTSTEPVAKTEINESKLESNSMIEDEYHCEYREEIWNTLLEQDAEKPTIHLQSPQLEFRGTLVQQLRDVTKKLGLSIGTLHSAVAQLDLFMDAHRLRADRLAHVALACLSLAAKSEEEFSRAPSLKTLSKASGVALCARTFRQLEWMVGQHARWRLLTPTPVAFAALLARHVAADAEISAHPEFRARFRRDALELLDRYLDLTLSDVRLKVLESVVVGCACVACARADLGLVAWPPWLAHAARRPHAGVAPLARLLHRMMQILKSRETAPEDVDQGYGSARTSPNITPSTSPRFHTSPTLSTCSSSSRGQSADTYRQHPASNYSVLDLSDTNIPNNSFYNLPTDVDMTMQRVNNPNDYRYCKARKMIDSADGASTSVAFKRGLDSNVEPDRKRYRLSSQMSQVVL